MCILFGCADVWELCVPGVQAIGDHGWDTTEAELIAMSTTSNELMWAKQL